MIPEDDQIGGKTSHPARADKIKSAEDLQRYCDQATKLASAILDDFERTLRTSNPYEVAGYMSAYTADHIPQMENMEDIGVDAAQIKLAEDAHSVLSQTILEGMSLAHLCADYLDSYIKTAEEIEENPEILAALSGGEAPEMTDEEAEVAEDEDEEIPPELLLSLLQHDDSDEKRKKKAKTRSIRNCSHSLCTSTRMMRKTATQTSVKKMMKKRCGLPYRMRRKNSKCQA